MIETIKKIENLYYLQIGVQGENNANAIQMDMSSWIDEYPGANISLLFKPYNAIAPSPMVTQLDGNILTWYPSSGATAMQGVGYTEVRAIDQTTGMVKKSRIIPTSVENSVSGNETANPPAPYQDWVTSVLNAGEDAQDAKTAAETAQEGAEDAQEAAEAARDAAQAAAGDFQGLTATATGLAAGQSPTVDVTHSEGGLYNLAFGIPKGDKGDKGDTGDPAPSAEVTPAVNAYLAANFSNPSNPPLDRSLASNLSAAPADMVGDLKSAMSAQVGADNVLFRKSSETVGASGQTYQRKDVFEYGGAISEGDWFGFTADSITGATNSSPMRIKLMNGTTEIRNISNGSFAKIEILDTDITAGINKVIAFIYASTGTAQTQACVATNLVMTKGESAAALNPAFTYSEDFNAAVSALSVAEIGNALYGGTISNTNVYASCDDLPVGKTFGITNAANIANKPASEGMITTGSRYANEATIRYQLFFAASGDMYTRVLWGTWKSWKQMSTSANYAAVLAKLGALQDITLGNYEAEFVNSTTGKFVAAANYSRTGFIPLKGVKIAVGVATTAANVGIAFYDSAKKYISGSDFAGHSVGDIVELPVPAYTEYFVYCGLSANSAHMHVANIQLANAVSLNPQNPCFWNGSNECRTFKKILCIGDSLTAGQFDYKENGTTKEFNDQDYAYPAYLKAITGRDTTNAGDAGETTVTWYALHGNEDFSGHDACIIHLGRNDYAGQNAVSSEDRIAAMNNIITKVKADNPQIKIFISTQINYYQYTNVGIINADMATVVENNADCYLLDIYTYGRMKLSDDAYSHCTAVGYQTLAEYYYRYISYIMHMQYAAFKTVQFTGTNRAY